MPKTKGTKKPASKKATSKKASRRKASSKLAPEKPVFKKQATKKTAAKRASEKKPATKKTASIRSAPSKKQNLAESLLIGGDRPEFQLVNRRTQSVERVITREEMASEYQLRQSELQSQFRDAQKAQRKLEGLIQAGYFGEGVSCSISFRKKFGQIVSPLRYVVEVHVPYKVSERQLSPWPTAGIKRGTKCDGTYCVPHEIDSVLTKVTETRVYRTSANVLTEVDMSNPGLIRDKKTRELRNISTDSKIRLGQTEVIGGLPTVEINQSNWGTFGIAFQGSTGSQAYGLVNSHFADGNMVQPPFKPTQEDQPIWSIGDVVAGKSFEGDIRGDSASERYYVDAALIALNDKRSFVMGLVHDFSDDPFLFANSFLRYTDPKTGRVDAFVRVFKFGARTLERLEGQLENPQDSVVLRKKRIGSVIRARRSGGYFTLPGDSGSALIAPIYDKISKRARFLVVGLCFAGVEGDASILYACHFAAVKKALKLDIPKSQLRDDWAYSKP